MALAVAALLLSACSADAASQREHAAAASFSFGSAGEGAGEFRFASGKGEGASAGIAVDEASADVYVADARNDRVQELSPEGAFVSAWGWGVSDGAGEYEVCTSSCRAGVSGVGPGEFKKPDAITVDNSPGGSGEVFVGTDPSANHPNVQRFPANGEQALGPLPDSEQGRLDGVGVDVEGRVWVYRGEEEETGVVEAFSDANTPTRLESDVLVSPLACPKPGFAVDSGGEAFYVGHELENALEECPAVVEREKAKEKEPQEGRDARPAVAGKLESAEVLAGGGAAISELDREPVTGVAVDQASSAQTPLGAAAKGDVYVDDGTSVAVFNASGELVQRLGAGSLKQGMGVAVDAQTGDVYVVEAAEDKVEVFEPEPVAAPVVEDLAAQNLTPNQVRLSAQVDPEGSNAHAYFQYGQVDCATDPSGCADSPAAPGEDVGGGFGGRPLGVTLEGLQPGATYFYRLVAANSAGGAEASEQLGTFTTLPSSQGLLADGRAWEIVSPAEKHGASIEPFEREGSLIQAAADGGAISYVASGPVASEPSGNRSPEPTQVISSRTAQGWSSEDASTPHDKGEGLEIGDPAEYRVFSEDLALALAQPTGSKDEPLEAPPLAEGAREKTLYVRDDPPLLPGPSDRSVYGAAEANAVSSPLATRRWSRRSRSPAKRNPGKGVASAGSLNSWMRPAI